MVTRPAGRNRGLTTRTGPDPESRPVATMRAVKQDNVSIACAFEAAADSDRPAPTGCPTPLRDDAGFYGDDDEGARPSSAGVRRPVGRARILIVDDEARIRLALRSCLEAEGYDVVEASDGREAIGCILGQVPDLLIIDLAMPVLDGLSTMKLLSTVYATRRPPAIVLTAYGSVSAAEMAFAFGAVGFLEKPVSPSVLRSAVAQVLDGRGQ